MLTGCRLANEDEERLRKDDARPLVGVIALTFLQYFATVGLVTSAHKNPVPFIPKGSLPEQVEEENQEELANPGLHGKQLLKRR